MSGSSRRHVQHRAKNQRKDQTVEVCLVFSENANKQFLKFGAGVREGLLRKLKEFALNPAIGKPLTGDLKGFYRISYGRIRAVVRSDGEHPVALVILTQVRKEGSSGNGIVKLTP